MDAQKIVNITNHWK